LYAARRVLIALPAVVRLFQCFLLLLLLRLALRRRFVFPPPDGSRRAGKKEFRRELNFRIFKSGIRKNILLNNFKYA
jgi:hypothetical protein